MSELMTVKEADGLYEGYGKPLEKDHHGEYAAISRDGRVIVGKNDIEVVDRAIGELGSGNFILYRVGYKYVGKIRRERCLSAMITRSWRRKLQSGLSGQAVVLSLIPDLTVT